MPIVVRPADLETDSDRLVDLLREQLNPLTDRKRFDWMYRRSPFGAATVWLAIEEESGEIVGSAGALPRPVYVDGRAVPGCVFADFWIHPRYRVLGPALKLQRACLSAVESSTYAIAYDFPRAAMVAVYKRLGFPLDAALVRLTRPLRLDRQIAARIGSPVLARAVSSVANTVFRWRDRLFTRAPEHVVSHGPAAFDADFTALASETAARHSPCVVRSAAYLNWRFRDHFHVRYELLAARRQSELRGYLVVTETAESLEIADALFADDDAVVRDLVAAASDLARQRRKQSLNVPLAASSPIVDALLRLGFYARERQAVIAYGLRPETDAGMSARKLPAAASWWFTAGDESD